MSPRARTKHELRLTAAIAQWWPSWVAFARLQRMIDPEGAVQDVLLELSQQDREPELDINRAVLARVKQKRIRAYRHAKVEQKALVGTEGSEMLWPWKPKPPVAPRFKPVEVKGVHYPSVKAAQKALHVGASGLRLLMSGEPKKTQPASKPVVWKGVAYPSQSAAARVLGVSVNTLLAMLKRGPDWKPKPCAGEKLSKRVTVDGVTYPSTRAAMRALGLSSGAWYRIHGAVAQKAG